MKKTDHQESDTRRIQIDKGGIGRHETFHPRYGWLKKGYDELKKDPHIFNAPDAIERLGVGKNMVQAIRFWCSAFYLIQYENVNGKNRKRAELRPTILADKIFGENGWDPYLEDFGSLWLLHWNLFREPYHAVSWPLIFNYCNLSLFDAKQLTSFLISTTKQYPKLSSISINSFEKDASCLIRMYARPSSDTSFDIECPFGQIGLLNSGAEPKTFRFNIATKQTLPSLIFLAASFSYVYQNQPSQRSLSLHKIVYDFNSPGVVFKISETEAGRLLDNAVSKIEGVVFVESMGNQQLQFDEEPDRLFWACLKQYYNDRSDNRET